MNYTIINDIEAVNSFINWLPALSNNEKFYVCLFARKKYDTTGTISKDRCQLKRFTATKETLVQKLRQLEIQYGMYTIDGKAIANETLAVYIMPNPRCMRKASFLTAKELLNDIEKDVYSNPTSVGYNAIQKSKSRTSYIDFDFDLDVLPDFTTAINENALTIVKTRGGFHVLVEVEKVEEQYKKSYYQAMNKLGADVSGDCLMPFVGCTQGGFTPMFLNR
jgi:hypothetical protein